MVAEPAAIAQVAAKAREVVTVVARRAVAKAAVDVARPVTVMATTTAAATARTQPIPLRLQPRQRLLPKPRAIPDPTTMIPA
jgi:hypothetical protein